MTRGVARLVLRGLSVVVGGLLSLVCGCPPRAQPMYGVPEYGMPIAQYRVDGTVKARTSQQPVAGIALTLRDTAYETGAVIGADTADSAGRYVMEFEAPPWPGTWRLSARDIDGAVNGRFAPKDTVISIPESTLTGGDGEWNRGYGQATVNIELDEIP